MKTTDFKPGMVIAIDKLSYDAIGVVFSIDNTYVFVREFTSKLLQNYQAYLPSKLTIIKEVNTNNPVYASWITPQMQNYYEQGTQSYPIDEVTEELLDHKKSSCPHCNTLFDGILCDNCGYFEDVEDVENYYKHRK